MRDSGIHVERSICASNVSDTVLTGVDGSVGDGVGVGLGVGLGIGEGVGVGLGVCGAICSSQPVATATGSKRRAIIAHKITNLFTCGTSLLLGFANSQTGFRGVTSHCHVILTVSVHLLFTSSSLPLFVVLRSLHMLEL